MSINLTTPQEMLKQIAERAKTRRLELDLSQITLSKKAGVSYGVLKKFERTGQISLESLLKLALILGYMNDFEGLLATDHHQLTSLDDLMKDTKRQRGRK